MDDLKTSCSPVGKNQGRNKGNPLSSQTGRPQKRSQSVREETVGKLLCLCVVDGTNTISMVFTLSRIGENMATNFLAGNVQSVPE